MLIIHCLVIFNMKMKGSIYIVYSMLKYRNKFHIVSFDFFYQLLRFQLVFIYFLLYSVSIHAQIPNNSFEQWNNSNGYLDPADWGTLNEYTKPYSVFTCDRLGPGSVGNYYLSVRTVSITGKGLVPGRIVSGKIDTVTYRSLSGFPFSLRPAYLSYDMQYMVASPNDTAYVSVLLTKWNPIFSKRDTIAYGNNYYNAMMHQWTSYSTYINYMSGDNPDSACIVISSSRYAPLQNSYVYIDNLKFNGSVIGVAEYQKSEVAVSAFPNPFTDEFKLNIESPVEDTDLFVYNCLGQLEHHIQKIQSFPLSVNTSQWIPGIYFAVIRYGNHQITKKIMK